MQAGAGVRQNRIGSSRHLSKPLQQHFQTFGKPQKLPVLGSNCRYVTAPELTDILRVFLPNAGSTRTRPGSLPDRPHSPRHSCNRKSSAWPTKASTSQSTPHNPACDLHPGARQRLRAPQGRDQYNILAQAGPNVQAHNAKAVVRPTPPLILKATAVGSGGCRTRGFLNQS